MVWSIGVGLVEHRVGLVEHRGGACGSGIETGDPKEWGSGIETGEPSTCNVVVF
jgi:hypothetical protein